MNLNFDEISKKVKKFSKDRVEDVQKLNELRVLNGQIGDAKKQIRDLYIEIGKKVFEQYKEAPLDGFETEIQSIIDKIALIEELKEKKRGVKQVVLCPCCNMEVPAGEKFCSNCGNKMPETEAEDDSEIVVDVDDVEEVPADGEEPEDETVEAVAGEAPEAETVETEAAAGEAPEDETVKVETTEAEAVTEEAPATEKAEE